MWLIASYEATTLFSLKPSTATSSGGRTLLAPSPFAIKMALLDVACRLKGLPAAQAVWPIIRDASVALRPARHVVVSNTFQRIIKPVRTDNKKDEDGDEETVIAAAFQRTIGYREYAQLAGDFGIAMQIEQQTELVQSLLEGIGYLGKRGGFVQWLGNTSVQDELDALYVMLTQMQNHFNLNGVLQAMDDCAPSLTFDKVNVYSDKRITLGKDRVRRNIVLPYQLKRSTRAYSFYELI